MRPARPGSARASVAGEPSSGGPGPNRGTSSPPAVAWVERGEAPDAVVGNDRPIVAYPHRAVYAGPGGRPERSRELGAGQLPAEVVLLEPLAGEAVDHHPGMIR
jgi:hypothetical protein